MDIFSQNPRTKSDAMNKPPLIRGQDNKQKQQRLKASHQKESQLFIKFIEKQYIKFDSKVNRCLISCISQSKSYSQIQNCNEICEKGLNKFTKYVDNRIIEMQSLLNNCVNNTQNLPNSLQEVYHCYDIYNKGFKQLKLYIQEQSMYYQ